MDQGRELTSHERVAAIEIEQMGERGPGSAR